MTSPQDIAKAFSAVRNLSKSFKAMTIVADVLSELGDIEKRCAAVGMKHKFLLKEIADLTLNRDCMRVESLSAEVERDVAVQEKTKAEVTAQKTISEIVDKARAEAAEISRAAGDDMAQEWAEHADAKDKALRELSDVLRQIKESDTTLNNLRNAIAEIKEKL